MLFGNHTEHLENFFNEIYEHEFFSSNNVHTVKDFFGNVKNIFPIGLGIEYYLFYTQEGIVQRDDGFIKETIYQVLRDDITWSLVEKIEKAKKGQPIYKGVVRNSLPLVGLWLHGMNLPTLTKIVKATVTNAEGIPIKIESCKINLCKQCLKKFEGKIPPENLHPQKRYEPGYKSLYKDSLRDIYEPKANNAYKLLKTFFKIAFTTSNISITTKNEVKEIIKEIKGITSDIAEDFWSERIRGSLLDCNFYIPFSDVSHIKTEADLEHDNYKDTFPGLTKTQEEAITTYLSEGIDDVTRLIELLIAKTGRANLKRAEAIRLLNIYTRNPFPQ